MNRDLLKCPLCNSSLSPDLLIDKFLGLAYYTESYKCKCGNVVQVKYIARKEEPEITSDTIFIELSKLYNKES